MIFIISAVAVLIIFGSMNVDILKKDEVIISDDSYSIGKGLSKEVLKYKDDIEKEVSSQGLDKKFTPILLAILQQESGGSSERTGGDIFQSSESKCGRIGCISDPKESIEQAVSKIKELSSKTDDVETIVQAYNFGDGYIDFVEGKKEKSHTQESAIEFSQMQMEKVDNPDAYSCITSEARQQNPPACYGDIGYVDRIMNYVDVQTNSVGGGKGLVVGDMALPLKEEYFLKNMQNGINGYDGHPGYDFIVPMGTEVYSIVDGTVVEIQNDRQNYPANASLASVLLRTDLGNFIRIRPDDNKDVMINYMHLNTKDNKGVLVKEGQKVKKGQLIGHVGNSGRTTAPHLHLDMLKNNVYDVSHAIHWYEELKEEHLKKKGD